MFEIEQLMKKVEYAKTIASETGQIYYARYTNYHLPLWRCYGFGKIGSPEENGAEVLIYYHPDGRVTLERNNIDADLSALFPPDPHAEIHRAFEAGKNISETSTLWWQKEALRQRALQDSIVTLRRSIRTWRGIG